MLAKETTRKSHCILRGHLHKEMVVVRGPCTGGQATTRNRTDEIARFS